MASDPTVTLNLPASRVQLIVDSMMATTRLIGETITDIVQQSAPPPADPATPAATADQQSP